MNEPLIVKLRDLRGRIGDNVGDGDEDVQIIDLAITALSSVSPASPPKEVTRALLTVDRMRVLLTHADFADRTETCAGPVNFAEDCEELLESDDINHVLSLVRSLTSSARPASVAPTTTGDLRNALVKVVEGFRLKGPPPIGPLYGAGWSGAISCIVDNVHLLADASAVSVSPAKPVNALLSSPLPSQIP